MEFIETEKNLRSLDLDKVEAFEFFSENQTKAMTASGAIYLVNVPYAVFKEIVVKRQGIKDNFRQVVENIDNNTFAPRA
jgi:hypothetical protein